MDIQIKNNSGAISVSDTIFAVDFNEPLVHQVVVAYLAGGRSGTKAQKTRSEVSGGGVKPWKQKGSGRARAGTIRSPIWRGGGVTFAAKNRDFSQKVNRKMYRSAICSILSELYRQERLFVIEKLDFDSSKTRDFVAYAEDKKWGRDFLLISTVINENVFLASRNIPKVSVADVESINPVLLLSYDKVIVTKTAIEKINEWLL